MSRGNIAVILAAFFGFEAVPSRAAALKQETVDAWDRYIHAANARLQDRAAQGQFLWIDESPERLGRVHAGDVVVSPMNRSPEAVPSGLIHHWIGGTFVPGARIDDVIAVVRDYDRYRQYYKPSVIDARTISRKAEEDRFSVVVIDKAMFMKRALDSEYQSRFVEVDGRKWYSIAQTTRIQELVDRRPVPEGEGSGYIWRLCTISRYEERDGGVYIETEAMALSRPIPVTLHWVVDPIVRRISRSSLTISLEQTRDATGSSIRQASALPESKRVTALRGTPRPRPVASCLAALNCP
jgi:hypothetical protein